MLISPPLPFVTALMEALTTALLEPKPGSPGLSRTQRGWLGLCLMGSMVTHSVCGARCERASWGRYSVAALAWMFRHTKLPWEWLLQLSVQVRLPRYGLTAGVLGADDSDQRRAKVTSTLAHVDKLKAKTSGGVVMGQCLVFLLLVTPTLTLPVGVAFYCPDPTRTAWAKRARVLKRQGVPKRLRPPQPPRQPAYPSKTARALTLLAQFRQAHPTLTGKAVLADALYGTAPFRDTAAALFGGLHVISHLHRNQTVRFRHRTLSVSQDFERYPGVPPPLRSRGGETITAVVSSARLYVCAQRKKRLVIALKYEGETDYRYLVASALTWRTQHIRQVATLRWLIEVFLPDWKAHEGGGAWTTQRGADGSRQSLILSLLVDHCRLLHPDQRAQLEQQPPAYTVGSLINPIKVDSLLAVIRALLATDHPEQRLAQLADTLAQQFAFAPSEKHLAGRDLGRLEPTPSLQYKAAA